jgi:alanine racemase
MHRLGFEPLTCPNCSKALREHPNLRVRSVFSHLAASDAPAHDAFYTRARPHAFSGHVRQNSPRRSATRRCATSSTRAASRVFREYHFDMVRLGIGLYGIGTAAAYKSQLRVVNTLKATISQIKEIPPGDTVGYNRNGPVHQPMPYRHHQHRLRRRAAATWRATDATLCSHARPTAPTIGNVCMDMTMVDVTHIPAAREGDEVIVFGENPPVQGFGRLPANHSL